MSHANDLPYELHTERELEFMLTRGKPLAHFCDAYPSEPNEEIIPEQSFAPHVADRTFEKRELVVPLRSPSDTHPHVKGIRHVFYAPAHETWRIDAYINMNAESEISGWSEDFERLQGRLLGYEDWQADVWLEHLRRSSQARSFFRWLDTPPMPASKE